MIGWYKKTINYFLVIILLTILIIAMYKTLVFPKKYKKIIEQACNIYKVDPNIIYAIIKQESKFNKNAISHANAKGLMQIMDGTAREVANKIDNIDSNSFDIFDEYTNIFIGTCYFKYLENYFNGNYYLAILAYNAGLGRVEQWFAKPYTKYNNYVDIIERVEYNETEKYFTCVIRYYYNYIKLYK